MLNLSGRRLATALLATLAACCGPKTPEPPCNLCQDATFAIASTPTALDDLKRYAALNPPDPTLTASQLLSTCRTGWQNVVEGTFCSQAVDQFCNRRCPQQDVEACKTPPRRELVLERCREQSLATFTAEIPACANFHICGSQLDAPTTVCASPNVTACH